MHIQALSFGATAPGAGGGAFAAVTSDSLTILRAKSKAQILGIWADVQGAGVLQIIRPSGHDTTRDMRWRTVVGQPLPLFPLGCPVFVEPEETLSGTIIGSATAGDRELVTMLLAFKDAPGVDQHLITWPQLVQRIDEFVTVEASITAAGGGVDYSGAELITAESDLLKANYDYALLGAVPTVQCTSVIVRGPDTGNVRVAIPGAITDPQLTGGWFGLLSRANGGASTIPVIQAGNRSQTFIEVLQDENNTAVTVALQLARLRRARE